jgi:hypothetical protein
MQFFSLYVKDMGLRKNERRKNVMIDVDGKGKRK